MQVLVTSGSKYQSKILDFMVPLAFDRHASLSCHSCRASRTVLYSVLCYITDKITGMRDSSKQIVFLPRSDSRDAKQITVSNNLHT